MRVNNSDIVRSYHHNDIIFVRFPAHKVTCFDKVRPAVIMYWSTTTGRFFRGAEATAAIHHIVLIVQYANVGFSVRGDVNHCLHSG